MGGCYLITVQIQCKIIIGIGISIRTGLIRQINIRTKSDIFAAGITKSILQPPIGCFAAVN